MNAFISNMIQAAVSTLVDPNIYHDKLPEVPDVSSNDPGATLSSLPVLPYGILGRASLAYYADYQTAHATSSVGADSYMPTLWAETRKFNVRCGPYAYILQNKIADQANCFIQAIKDCGMWKDEKYLAEFPPCADVEVEVPAKPRKLPKNYVEPVQGIKWAAQIKEFLDRVEEALGVTPMIYTARPQWKWLLDPAGNPPAWTKRHLLWAKFYPDLNYIDANASFPASYLPTGFTMDQLVFWQYFDQGRTYKRKFNDENTITLMGQKLFGSVIPVVSPVVPPIIPTPETDYLTGITMVEHFKSGASKSVEIQL